MIRNEVKRLVRDGVIDELISDGVNPDYVCLEGNTLAAVMARRVGDSANELGRIVEHGDIELIKGLISDIRQVLDDMGTILGLPPEELSERQTKLAQTQGTYVTGVLLRSVEVPEQITDSKRVL